MLLLILPFFVTYKWLNQFGDVEPVSPIDFRAITLSERRLSFKEGFIYHFWQDSNNYDWISMYIIAFSDVLTAISSPFFIVTLPMQYLILGVVLAEEFTAWWFYFLSGL